MLCGVPSPRTVCYTNATMSKKQDNAVSDPVIDDALAGALGEGLKPIGPPAHRARRLRQSILDRIAQQSLCAAVITVRADEGEWVVIAPGVTKKLLYQDEAANINTYLLRMQPGACLPPHQHVLDEECLVLEGEASLGDLRVYAGDYHLAPKGIPHGVVRSETGALLLLRGELQPKLTSP